MTDSHGWHLFDAVQDIYVCQTTGPDQDDQYEVRTGEDGPVTVLDADEFAQLRDPGPNPRGL